jgi:hypothetical protein
VTVRPFLCSEFLDFVASRFGAVEIDDVPDCGPGDCDGPGHVRILADVLAGRTAVPAAVLLSGFGTVLFGRLIRRYPSFFVGIESTVDLVRRFDGTFAAEVRKLAPDAQLGTVAVDAARPPRIEVDYRSPDGLADLAQGLICGSVAHFAEPLVVERRDPRDASGREARFALRPRQRR